MSHSGDESSNVAYRAVLLAAALVVLGLLFRELLTLMLAVLVTVIAAIALSSIAGLLQRFARIPRPVGALLGLLGGVGIVAGVVALIIPPFIDQTNAFVDAVPRLIDTLRDRTHDLTGARPADISQSVQGFAERYTENPGRLVGPITSIGLGIVGLFGALLLILITAYYMAVNPEPLLNGARRLVAPAHRDRFDAIAVRLRRAWIGWLQGVAIDVLLTGVLLFAGLSLIGLDYAIFFAVLAALLCVIPYFGAFAGGLPPFLLALTDSPGKALLVLFVYTLVQQIEGNVTIPLVMAKTVRLHPALIAVGVVVVGQLFGFGGLVVAVPILSMIVILAEELWIKPMEEAAQAGREPPVDDVVTPIA